MELKIGKAGIAIIILSIMIILLLIFNPRQYITMHKQTLEDIKINSTITGATAQLQFIVNTIQTSPDARFILPVTEEINLVCGLVQATQGE